MQPASSRCALRWTASVACGLLIVALSLLGAATASAASIRYAAPTPLGTQDCSSPANACGLKKAATDVAVADGDEVILAPGEYVTSQGIEVTKAIDIHGGGLPSATRIVSTPAAESGITLTKEGTKLHDLEIDYGGVFSGLFAGAGTVDRVIVISSSGSGCGLSNATLLDTICVSKSPIGAGVSANWSGGSHVNVLRNVTAIGAGTNGVGMNASGNLNTAITIDAKNVIARGSGTGDDVHASADATSQTVIDLDHSNFSKVFSFANTGGTSSVTEPSASGNQTTAPAFVDAASGDYHQAAGSMTIDAGVADAANGPLDIDDAARTQGLAIDIGADEFTPPAPPTEGHPALDTTAPLTSISRHPARTIRVRAKRTKVTFRFGSDDPTAHYECSLDSKPFSPCASPKTLTIKRGRHTFSVRATDPTGNTDPTPARFTWTVKPKPVPHR